MVPVFDSSEAAGGVPLLPTSQDCVDQIIVLLTIILINVTLIRQIIGLLHALATIIAAKV
jgi:hypothetical protein